VIIHGFNDAQNYQKSVPYAKVHIGIKNDEKLKIDENLIGHKYENK